MSGDRRLEVARHVSEEELDQLLNQIEDEKVSKRLTFVKRLYKGSTPTEAADDVGKSPSTGNRWLHRWNEAGLGQLTPNFGGGRPPKLDEDQQQKLLELLHEDQPWKSQEIQQLLIDEFDVEFHPDYLGKFLRDLGLSYARPHDQNGQAGQRTLMRSSKSASTTRSTRTTIHITNRRVRQRRMAGSLTTMSVPMVEL